MSIPTKTAKNQSLTPFQTGGKNINCRQEIRREMKTEMFVDGVGVVKNVAIVANGGWQGKLKAKYSPPAPLYVGTACTTARQ